MKPADRDSQTATGPGMTRGRQFCYLKASVLAAAGFTPTEAAWLLDTSRATMTRAAHRLGFEWKARDGTDDFEQMRVRRDLDATEAAMQAAGNVRSLQERVAAMPPRDAVEHLVWLLGELLWAEESHSLTPAPGLRLSPTEARALFLLDRRRGSVVRRTSIMAALYSDRSDGDTPDDKIADVIICKIRAKLSAAGVPARILTRWGSGFVLDCAAGVLDWQRLPAQDGPGEDPERRQPCT